MFPSSKQSERNKQFKFLLDGKKITQKLNSWTSIRQKTAQLPSFVAIATFIALYIKKKEI